jgi:hypothetical protein
MKRQISLVGDGHRGRAYVIPTKKGAEFQAWVAYVNGGEQKYDGEDFSDYRCGRPLATLVLTKPYRRFSRRRAPLRNIRDARDN